MKKLIFYKQFRYLYWFYKNQKIKKKIKQFIKKNQKREKNILLLMTPVYENLGDQAIAYAELLFFQKYLPNKKVLEITNDLITPIVYKVMNKYSENFSNVIITGGGFLGTLWFQNEKQVRAILNGVKNSKVTIFPQTVYFENSEFGRKELEHSKKIVSGLKDVDIYIRDKSFAFVKTQFINKSVFSVPDIVFFLNYSKSFCELHRNGVLLCFRNDKEKVINNEQILRIEVFLKASQVRYDFTDTLAGHKILPKKRKYELENKLRVFKSSNLVITDRLHAMLFCLITGTPCIAVNNISKKIEGIWQLWLKDFDYIHFCESFCDIDDELINRMLMMGGRIYNSKYFEKYWLEMSERLDFYE